MNIEEIKFLSSENAELKGYRNVLVKIFKMLASCTKGQYYDPIVLIGEMKHLFK